MQSQLANQARSSNSGITRLWSGRLREPERSPLFPAGALGAGRRGSNVGPGPVPRRRRLGLPRFGPLRDRKREGSGGADSPIASSCSGASCAVDSSSITAFATSCGYGARTPVAAAYARAAPFAPYCPGFDVVDALAIDTYGGQVEQEHYDALCELAGGRPIGLGGRPAVGSGRPRRSAALELVHGMAIRRARENDEDDVLAVCRDARVVTLEGLAAYRP